ncbi:MAG TPA: DUF1992 domain-containing protein [Myxococcaceae bacterium]|jgi:hypothetical protein
MMPKGMHRFIEARIQESQSRGELDNLPGKGQPLPEDETSSLPEEQRAEALLLRVTGAAEEVALLKELAELRERLDRLPPGTERQELREAIRTKAVRLSLMFERAGKFLTARSVLERADQ